MIIYIYIYTPTHYLPSSQDILWQWILCQRISSQKCKVQIELTVSPTYLPPSLLSLSILSSPVTTQPYLILHSVDPLSEDILSEIQVTHLTYNKPFLSPFLPPYSITESSHTHSTLPLSFNQALLTSVTGYPLCIYCQWISTEISPSSLNPYPFTPFSTHSSPHHSLTSHRVSSDSGSSVRGYPLRNSRFKFGLL